MKSTHPVVAMRDSLLAGIKLVIGLNQALGQYGLEGNFHFVHILITDGQDTNSKATLQETALAINFVGSNFPVSRCKTEIIGIDLGEDQDAAAELMVLDQFGLKNCRISEIDSVEISELFSRIQVEIRQTRQTQLALIQNQSGQYGLFAAQRNQVQMFLRKVSFAIIFNIDISGSMAGRRYSLVKQSVQQFLSDCPEDDLVAGICFNDTWRLLHPREQLISRQLEYVSPQPRRVPVQTEGVSRRRAQGVAAA